MDREPVGVRPDPDAAVAILGEPVVRVLRHDAVDRARYVNARNTLIGLVELFRAEGLADVMGRRSEQLGVLVEAEGRPSGFESGNEVGGNVVDELLLGVAWLRHLFAPPP